MSPLPPHLQALEDESIYIIREAVASAQNPVLLYSIGKDSSVVLHLLLKAFYPAKPPVPLMHIDSTWEFQDMYHFRDQIPHKHGVDLMVHINPQGIKDNVNPYDHGSRHYTQVMRTDALKQALDSHKFDFIFVGGRRDEEKSRAKERVFSLRNRFHAWDPKNQRPEFGSLFNTRLPQGHSMRVSPIANWTEYDVWIYIMHEQIDVVPLYFAASRPTIERDGTLLMVDDNRMQGILPDEVKMRQVRFRTLGCYPLTGGIESVAITVQDIVHELENTNHSERQGRLIDADSAASMEKKKRMGYF